MFIGSSRWRKALIAAVVAAVLVGLAVGLYFLLRPHDDDSPGLPPSDSVLGVFNRAAVATNGYLCAGIGRDILAKGGNAVEAAIAALFCEGVICLQSMGLGGGFLMTIYKRETKTAITLNARETAPLASSEEMYHGNSTLSQFGGLATAVPGELKGYWAAFNSFGSGNVTWKELVSPSIKLCQDGFEVSSYLANILQQKESNIKASETLSELLINPLTGRVWKVGDILVRPQLAETLTVIAENGIEPFYSGSLGEQFISDVRSLGGILTMEDLKSYNVRWEEPVTAKLKENITLYTTPLPGSGPLVAFMMNILNDFIQDKEDVITYQRIIETFKYAYGIRTQLGDPYYNNQVYEIVKNLTSVDYARKIREQITDNKTFTDPEHYGAVLSQPEDHGTAHISVLAPNGDAVSVTSTINLIFGAMVVSNSTGIILNDEMDDFSAPNITNAYGIPPSYNNFIQPGKRPLSSMSPSIYVDHNGDVRLVVGSAGGSKITTANALMSIYNLWFGLNIKEAIDHRRIHHQLFPMAIQYEDGFQSEIIKGLQAIGHEVQEYEVGGSTATGIAVQDGKIYANSDFRREGVVAGL